MHRGGGGDKGTSGYESGGRGWEGLVRVTRAGLGGAGASQEGGVGRGWCESAGWGWEGLVRVRREGLGGAGVSQEGGVGRGWYKSGGCTCVRCEWLVPLC